MPARPPGLLLADRGGMSTFRTIIGFAPPLAAAVALTGCAVATEYAYVPQQASVVMDGFDAVRYPVPPEEPTGSVTIASFGFTELATGAQGSVAALHVRMVVDNEGDETPWTVDTGDQLVEIAGEGQSRPLLVNTDIQALPIVSIGRRQKRVFDLYFPLPTTVTGESQLPAFDVLWQVRTPARAVADRTSFRRFVVDTPSPPPEPVLLYGWGPYWWLNPAFPSPVFVHPRVIVVQPPLHRVVIRRHPPRHHHVVVRRRR